ncbi:MULTISPECIES: MarR family winged helix-turn-helix transcriptional regulator [unclassified Pigmentiphaga]|jgi:DNA-binding MarR family transcriptional regulator|uniref:MarR family winged helix-turn-helix transcriptional regulator n=1 Tax=unclassified Pigmentiphaga TaxID=2626614 RepID=UPI001045D9B6|nr:MarR family winged helix-turn-helix transcriptional regulator [Pigmentiphaga sp. D-2]
MAIKRSTPASSRPAGEHPSLQLDAFLPYRLNMLSSLVADRFARSYAAYSERFGIDGPRWRVISFLGERRGAEGEHAAMTARDICAKTRMTKVMVSRAITDLEAAGLIRRRPNENDRREAFLDLTDAGQEVYWAIVPVALEFQEDLLSGLSAQERATLFRVVDKLQGRALEM